MMVYSSCRSCGFDEGTLFKNVPCLGRHNLCIPASVAGLPPEENASSAIFYAVLCSLYMLTPDPVMYVHERVTFTSCSEVFYVSLFGLCMVKLKTFRLLCKRKKNIQFDIFVSSI